MTQQSNHDFCMEANLCIHNPIIVGFEPGRDLRVLMNNHVLYYYDFRFN